jgi:hypothetical protein
VWPKSRSFPRISSSAHEHTSIERSVSSFTRGTTLQRLWLSLLRLSPRAMKSIFHQEQSAGELQTPSTTIPAASSSPTSATTSTSATSTISAPTLATMTLTPAASMIASVALALLLLLLLLCGFDYLIWHSKIFDLLVPDHVSRLYRFDNQHICPPAGTPKIARMPRKSRTLTLLPLT